MADMPLWSTAPCPVLWMVTVVAWVMSIQIALGSVSGGHMLLSFSPPPF